jgi:polyhydroxyalkanoate synthesis regulator phasin
MADLATELRRAFLAGFGALTLSKNRVQELIDELVSKGEMKEKDAREYVQDLLERSKKEREALQNSIRDEVETVVRKMGVVTREDLKAIDEKIESIERAVAAKK